MFATGSAEEMIANCHTFVTRYSSTVFVALALGKEVVCDLDVEMLKRLLPLRHGQAAQNVAAVCRELLEESGHSLSDPHRESGPTRTLCKTGWR